MGADHGGRGVLGVHPVGHVQRAVEVDLLVLARPVGHGDDLLAGAHAPVGAPGGERPHGERDQRDHDGDGAEDERAPGQAHGDTVGPSGAALPIACARGTAGPGTAGPGTADRCDTLLR